jgi:D-glycero-alpha-D-manno-heptose 1-phosphate guanylyltransferase
MAKDCIILAGGFGTRLSTVVSDRPKCLAPIAGQPFLAYLLQYLQQFDIGKVVLSLGYKAEMVIDWIAPLREQYPFAIEWVVETEPLGTGGAIQLALQQTTTDDVVIINGDSFYQANIAELLAFHEQKTADLTLSLKPMQHYDRYGTVEINENGRITTFHEKQFTEQGLINGGVYVLYKPALLNLGFPAKFSFEQDFMEKQLTGTDMYGYTSNGYFIDIGVPEDFARANTELPALIKM